MKHLGMDPVLYGYYGGYNTVLRGLGIMLVVPVFKRCGLRDTIVLLLSTISKTLGLCFLAFAFAVWMVFLG